MADKLTLDPKATKGFVLGLAEIRQSDGKVFPLTKGPFAVDVLDPNSTSTIVPGSDDQTTPTIFRPNGTLAEGTVTINVTDMSNGLKGSVSYAVASAPPPPPPPPPPDAPDTLVVSLAPEP